MKKIFLNPGREKSVRAGHPWLFSGAVYRVESGIEPGEIVSVCDPSATQLGLAFYHPEQSIAGRFLKFGPGDLEKDFWFTRVERAVKRRKELFSNKDCDSMRLVNAEGDGLPGLIADMYAGHLVVQIGCAGMEKVREEVLAALEKIAQPLSIWEQDRLSLRQKEGLAAAVVQLKGTTPDFVRIKENGAEFDVDIKRGQKTGFFLDQRDNRLKVQQLARGRRVLNTFCYTGGFTVQAALGGALSTVSVDMSKDTCALCEDNLKLNKLSEENHKTVCADTFTYLREQPQGEFDFIILDPPAFAKSGGNVPQAARGYKDINRLAFKILPPGGILVTASCSQHVDRMLFQKIVHDAAVDAGRSAQIFEVTSHACDHPFDLSHPEGEYLKCLFVRVD